MYVYIYIYVRPELEKLSQQNVLLISLASAFILPVNNSE